MTSPDSVPTGTGWPPVGLTARAAAGSPDRAARGVPDRPRRPGKDRSGIWLRNAAAGLGLLAVAAAAVSFTAQYRMVYTARRLPVIAGLEAVIPDAAALIFACLGIALALHGAGQWALTLAETSSDAQKTVATVRMVMSRALSFMADPALAASVLPDPGSGFGIGRFLADRGTLYMIADQVSEDAPVAPLFAAMATEIQYQASQIGQASPSRRLDPALLMGLDEVTQICPVPLPVWLSDSGGKGIQVVAIAHGEAQLAGRWGDHGRQVVMDTSSVKVFLPGITDTTTLDAASKLCGQALWKIRGHYHATWHDIASPDMIRQLPAGYALVIRGGCAPVVARLPRGWKNPAYRRARRAGRLVPASRAIDSPGALPVVPDYVPDDLDGGGTSFGWA